MSPDNIKSFPTKNELLSKYSNIDKIKLSNYGADEFVIYEDIVKTSTPVLPGFEISYTLTLKGSSLPSGKKIIIDVDGVVEELSITRTGTIDMTRSIKENSLVKLSSDDTTITFNNLTTLTFLMTGSTLVNITQQTITIPGITFRVSGYTGTINYCVVDYDNIPSDDNICNNTQSTMGTGSTPVLISSRTYINGNGVSQTITTGKKYAFIHVTNKNTKSYRIYHNAGEGYEYGGSYEIGLNASILPIN